MTTAVGMRLGPYEILSLLGAGGMGDVYRARDTELNRDVAIKILPEAFARDEERVGRFKREAQVLASLNHPNIAAIYGVEESDGIRTLVMELVEGPTLAERIAAGPIPLDEALAIARQIAEALEVAHERGVIHRDLKPANVKVTSDDKVKVLDFGLAKIASNEAPSSDLSHSPTMIQGTQAGMILGTAAYMSPEQAKGKAVDKRSDVWAFGCVLFEMLTGKHSFSGETLTDVLAAVVRRWPDALPNGKAILFSVAYDVGNPLDNANVALLDLNSGKHRILIKGGAFARYLSAGYIVYAHGNTLLAVPFNLKTLEVTGSPVTLLENVIMSQSNARVQFSLSRGGDLVYLEGRSDDSRDAAQPLVWLDRHGSEQPLTKARQRFSKPRLTADGRTLFVEVADPEAAIWAYDINRETLTRVTHGGVSYGPVPSPDGTRVAYEATRDGVAGALLARIDGSDEQRLTSTKRIDVPTSWSPDGKLLALTGVGESGNYEVRFLPVDGDHTPQIFVQGPFNAGGARFSPDGHWVAYVSDESGRNEVYVRPFPEAGTRVQISAAGGSQPVWSRNGHELFFRSGNELLAVNVTLAPNLTAGKPVVLFSRSMPEDSSGMAYDFMADYDVSNDGRRFVFPKYNPNSSNVPRAIVILDWFLELKRVTTAGK